MHPSEPPTAVRNLKVDSKTNTSITIQWDPPSMTGRSDYYYNVEYSDPNNISKYIQHNQERVTETTMYSVTGLQLIKMATALSPSGSSWT